MYIALKSFQKSASMSQVGTVGPTAATLRNAAFWWPRRPLHDHRQAVATLGVEKSFKEAILISCRAGTEELRNGWSGGTSNVEVWKSVEVMQARQRELFSANKFTHLASIRARVQPPHICFGRERAFGSLACGALYPAKTFLTVQFTSLLYLMARPWLVKQADRYSGSYHKAEQYSINYNHNPWPFQPAVCHTYITIIFSLRLSASHTLS